MAKPTEQQEENHADEASVSGLIARVYDQLPYAKTMVDVTIRTMFKEMAESLRRGEVVRVPYVGKLWVKVPPEGLWRHHNRFTKEYEFSPRKKHVKFKENQHLFIAINEASDGKTQI